jgi:hypothetical protein
LLIIIEFSSWIEILNSTKKKKKKTKKNYLGTNEI